MIFDTPNLRSGTGYPGDPTSLGEVAGAAYRGHHHIESWNALQWQLDEEYTSRANAIKEASGIDFAHPLQTEPNVERLMARATQRGRHWFNETDILEIQLEEAAERLQELQKKHPELAKIIRADNPPHLDVYRRMRRVEGERADVYARRGVDSISGMLTDPLAAGAIFAGNVAGSWRSPADIAGFVLGGVVGRPAYSLLRNALRNATANAAVQTLLEPAVQRNRAMAGLEAGWGPAMENIAMAFGIGGFLDLSIRTPGRAFKMWRGDPNLGGFFTDAPQAPAPGVDAGARAPVPRLPEVPQELISRAQQGDVQAMTDIAEMVTGQPVQMPEGVTREMIGKALDGDPEALTQVIERSGLAQEPAIKGALDRFILEGDNAETQAALQRVRDEFAGITTQDGGRIDIDIGQDQQRILQALRAAMDPDEPTPTGGMDLQIARRAALADDEPLPRGAPGTNQHELKIDIFGRTAAVREIDLKLARIEGDVQALRAQQWSGDLAGRVLAFEPRHGPLVIMDGRRRAELAQRVPEAKAEGIVFREADGWTQADVAGLARRKNAAEGKGSPVELAESLRSSPELLDLIEPDTLVTRTARSMAMLSDEAFGMVKAGDADPRMAAMVSDMVANEALHAQLLRDLKAAGIDDLTQARRTLNDLMPSTGAREANATLLGLEPDDMPLRAGADVEDPKGTAAKAQTQRLERELQPEIADARAKGPPPPDAARTAAEAKERAAQVRAAIEQVVGRMPDDLRVETFSAIGDLPDPIQAEVARGNAVAFSNALQRVQAARTPTARARALADLEAAKRGQGVEGFERDGVVYVATYAVDPDGILHHEIVHWLKRTGRITDQEIALLAKRARKEGLLDEALYREAMAGRTDLDARLDEEAAAHLMQARKEGRSFGRKADGIIDKALRTLEMIGNALRGYGFRTADDVVEAILSGEMARRGVLPDQQIVRMGDGAMFALRRPTLSIPGLKEKVEARQERARLADAARELRRPFASNPQLSEWLDVPASEFIANIGHIAAKRKAKDGAGLGDLSTPEAVRAHIEEVLASGTVAYLYRTEDGTDSLNLVKIGEQFDSVVSIRLRSERGRLFIPTAFNQLPRQTAERLGRSVDLNGADSLKWQKTQAARREILKRIAQAPAEVQGSSWHQLRQVLRQEQEGMGRDEGTMFSLRSEEVAPGIRTRPWADTPPPVPGTVVRGETMFAIRAFHASPHDFEPEPGAPVGRFRMDRMGTGEGTQFAGHGLYFSESEAVSGRGGHYDRSFSTPDNPARIYEVSLDVEESALLDFEGRISGQPLLAEALSEVNAKTWSAYIGYDQRFFETEAQAKEWVEKEFAKAPSSNMKRWKRPRVNWVNDAPRERQTFSSWVPGEGPGFEAVVWEATRPDQIPHYLNSPEFIDKLKSKGVKGIRGNDSLGPYIVVFDESLIEITAKDGKPVTQQEASGILSASRGDDEGAMFALRQDTGTPQQRPEIDIASLAQRLVGIADTYRAAVSGDAIELPDTALNLGRGEDGLITSVEAGGETYFVARDEAGNITGLMTADEATERAIADTIRTTARDTGYDLDPERVDAYTAEAMAIVRTAQEDPQGALQAASDLIARISDEITPDEPAMRADNDNQIPPPLRQDLADVDRLNEHAEMVSVCRL